MSEEIKIESGVPAPVTDFPLKAMKVGDSFFLSDETTNKKTLRAAIWKYAVTSGKRFTTRSADNGIRVWRLK